MGAAAVEELLERVKEKLKTQLDLELDVNAHALELDSSTTSKFSRHLIVALPDAAFASNAHVGALVREICDEIWEDHRQGHPTACVGSECLLVDQAVYSRNRAFRLPLSSKFGKEAVLLSSGRFGGQGLRERQVFDRSLVCRAGGPRRVEWGDCGLPGGCAPRFAAGPPARTGSSCSLRYDPCPMAGLAPFVVAVCQQGGACPNASIRSWTFLPEGALMLFNIAGCRYCARIGREHRSNGVFIVVDLRGGAWTQRCYDPDCRAFRGPFTALPPDVHRACVLHLERAGLAGGAIENTGGAPGYREGGTAALNKTAHIGESACPGDDDDQFPSDAEMLHALWLVERQE
ncbi:hypothetical protein QBZ16_004277 [Prototheca wickerhamii]|uniref:DNA-directed primase/polymerase protein n=1 Tax=Prototheca wickerhamii TaxID=3111 RepID=A0AAD9MHW0_PROWI|nr:hypothetical protein QBZ16_004277 [Prototheca wickerhamii]